MEDWEQLRADVKIRKAQQNARREAKGLAPRHKLHNQASKPLKGPARAQKPPPPESGDEDDTALSFEEWKACGWCVKKGERSEMTDILGVPQFTRSQVRKDNPAWSQWRTRKK